MRQNGNDKNMVNGYQSKMIATALSKPSNKAVFFNNVSVFSEISEGRSVLKIEFNNLSSNINSYWKLNDLN